MPQVARGERLAAVALGVAAATIAAGEELAPFLGAHQQASALAQQSRWEEAARAYGAFAGKGPRDPCAPLASIFLCGSILEGLLLSAACTTPKEVNQASASPKDDAGKVKQFQYWKLSEFIDVAWEVGCLTLDVKKFSHVMRDFRNYIHPYQQMSSRFNPDKHTGKICLQVLRAAIACLGRERG